MTRLRTGLVLAAVVLEIAGCRPERADGRPIVTVEHGIRTVANTSPAWTPDRGWTVATDPMVDIGNAPRGPEYELEQTLGPLRLHDGRIVLFHGGVNELRYYDSAGNFQRRAGRVGRGPGEFQNVTGLWLTPGDSVVVVQSFERRLSVFDSNGEYRRSATVQGGGSQFMVWGGKLDAVGPIGRFRDGSVLIISQLPESARQPTGVYRDTVVAIVYGPDGVMVDTVGRLPAAEMETVSFKAGSETVSAPGLVPLGKETLLAVRADRWAVARNDAWEVEVRQPNGSVLSLIRAAVPTRTMSPEDITTHRSAQLMLIEGQRAMPEFLRNQLRTKAERAHYPDHWPPFAALLFDEDGHLWAEETASGTNRGSRWAVVDTSGTWLGSVTMPPAFRPTFIGSEAVYGIWSDENDVEHVRVYLLRRAY